jgi:hypothetical protein
MIRLNPQQKPDKAVTLHCSHQKTTTLLNFLQQIIESSWKLMQLLMKGCRMLQDIMMLKNNGNHT